MIEHIHWRRSGETKLVVEMTLSSEEELSQNWDRICAWFKSGPRALQLTLGKSKTISLERLKT